MYSRRKAVLIAAAALAVFSGAIRASDDKRPESAPSTVDNNVGQDRFAAGGSVRIDTPVAGDLVAAGGSIDVDAPVSGDALIFGGNVRLGSTIGQSLYASGGQLVIRGRIARNARFAGGQVELAPNALVNGNVSVGGGQVTLNGAVKGYVQAAGGNLVLNGPIDGDVLVSGGKLELGPQARINGKLRYVGRDEIQQHPDALVKGGIERSAPRTIGDRREPSENRSRSAFGGAGAWIWTAGLMLLAGVLVAALPGLSARVASTLTARPGLSLLLGFVVLVCLPVAAVILLITIIGVPLGLLALALYLPLLLTGYVTGGIGLGHWALNRFKVEAAGSLWWRIGAAAVAVLALALCSRIPWLGGLIGFATLLAGLGALALQLRRAPTA